MTADDAPVMIDIDAEADPVTMTVTGSFITTLLGFPMGTELTSLHGHSLRDALGSSVAHAELRKHVVLGVVSAQQARGDAGLPRTPAIGVGGG